MSSLGEVESKSNTPRATKKKKRRRISKHVQLATSKSQAASDHAAAAAIASGVGSSGSLPVHDGGGGAPSDITAEHGDGSNHKRKRRSNDSRVKDPSEALSYLHQWKEHRLRHELPQQPGDDDDDDGIQVHDAVASKTWKFNKNTQSWLVRHMYEPNKVPKHAFELLAEYLRDMHDGTAKTRMLNDARRRVLRYKRQQQQNEQQEDPGKSSEPAKEPESSPADGNLLSSSGRGDNNPSLHDNDNFHNDQDGGDEAKWRRMSEHDRRKEYKRARRVLELFPAAGTAAGTLDG